MSSYLCQTPIADSLYPPVQETALDQAREEQLATLNDKAPFGYAKQPLVPGGSVKSGYKMVPVTSAQYLTAMNAQIKGAKAIDFRWPFWTGLGLGAVGFFLLVRREKR